MLCGLAGLRPNAIELILQFVAGKTVVFPIHCSIFPMLSIHFCLANKIFPEKIIAQNNNVVLLQRDLCGK